MAIRSRLPIGQDDAFGAGIDLSTYQAGDVYGFTPPPPPTASAPPPVIAEPNRTSPTVTAPSSFTSPTSYNTTGWNVESYGNPLYIASAFGGAPAGYDAGKWADPLHQTPKYVWGRIAEEARASGAPNWEQIAIDNFIKAYPGTVQESADSFITPWGESIDPFRDFGGESGTQWMVRGAGGGGAPSGFSLSSLFGSRTPSAPSGGGAPAPTGGHPFADPGFQAVMNAIGPAHPQYAEYQAWLAAGGAGAPGSSASGGSASGGPVAPQGGMQSLYDAIGRLLGQGGGLNDDILNRRVESARETLERQRNAELDTMRGQLSSRGLLGQGAEYEGTGRVNEGIADKFSGAVRDIYADESARSDERLLRTMSIAAGLSADDADRLVDWFNAQTGREVGLGQIAATRERTGVERELGLGELGIKAEDLGLRRDLGFGQLGLQEYGLGLDHNRWLNEFGLSQDRFAFDQSRAGQQDIMALLPFLFPGLFE